MRIVIQRVSSASVTVDGEMIAAIGPGLLLLVGVAVGDDEAIARKMAQKCAEMRVFSDEEGRFNLSLLETAGEALAVSQFTLLADSRRGRRPSFDRAAQPEVAEPLFAWFVQALSDLGIAVAAGRFGARMQVALVNEGPVTIVLDSRGLERPRRAPADN
ncbi:MAG: D-aminoacyl-tRNA deacylase [Chloroflexi bacterium]|nr:D-aminoacyl-tRNA deacylase [Chloroflexota bacterium]